MDLNNQIIKTLFPQFLQKIILLHDIIIQTKTLVPCIDFRNKLWLTEAYGAFYKQSVPT